MLARSPLERMRAVAQAQGHPGSNAEDVATMFTIARFVNSKSGASTCRLDTFARILRINRRALFKRLKRLADRGHIEITRRGPHPAAISLVLLPDCIPEEVHSQDTSSPTNEVHSQDTYNEVHSGDTYTTAKEVHSGDPKRCTPQKIDDLNSDSYAPRTREEEQGNRGAAEFSEHEIASFTSNAAPESRGEIFRRCDGQAARPEGAPADDHATGAEMLDPGPARDDVPAYDIVPFASATTRPKAALTREVALDYGVDPDAWEQSL